MYSQKDEEKYIVHYFKDAPKGKFLDFGGYDPKEFSNTRRLYELGWKGIYLEPSKPQYENFEKEYAEDVEMTLINKAVSTYDGEITFYNCNDGPSTTEISHKEKWLDRIQKWNEEIVPCISINTLLEKYAHEIDFLNIDVEGANIQLFRAIEPKYLRNIKMICFEHDEYHIEMVNSLARYGFQLILNNEENILMVKGSFWTLINKIKSFYLLSQLKLIGKKQILKLLMGFTIR